MREHYGQGIQQNERTIYGQGIRHACESTTNKEFNMNIDKLRARDSSCERVLACTTSKEFLYSGSRARSRTEFLARSAQRFIIHCFVEFLARGALASNPRSLSKVSLGSKLVMLIKI